MTKSTFLFTLALLEAKAWAQQMYGDSFADVDIDMAEDEDPELTALRDLQESNIHQSGYFRTIEYQSKTAKEKMEDLWDLLVPDPNDDHVKPTDFMWTLFPNFFTQKSQGSFHDDSDELRQTRFKTTHTQGLVAQIEWKSLSDRFTGIYTEGTEDAILRMSQTTNLTDQSTGLVPSLAIKFLLDGYKSENLFGMPNFTGLYLNEETGDYYTSWDFFEAPFKSRVEPFTDQCSITSVLEKMLEGNMRPFGTAVGIPAFYTKAEADTFGDRDSPITRIETRDAMKDRQKYQFPYQVEYEGVHHFTDNRNLEWHWRMRNYFNTRCDADSNGRCASPVKIFDVYAYDAPPGHTDLNGDARERHHIGEINLLTKLYTSQAGDTRLFFQHRRVYNDHVLWPNHWRFPRDENVEFVGDNDEVIFPGIHGLDQSDPQWPWPDTDQAAEEEFLRLTNEGNGCPFAFLF